MRFSIIFSFLIAFLGYSTTYAQKDSTTSINKDSLTVLPKTYSETKNGVNFIYWNNPYKNGIKSVIIERSADKNYNYATLSVITKHAFGYNMFEDQNANVGENYYRLKIIFDNDVTWLSDVTNQKIDSATFVTRKKALTQNPNVTVTPPSVTINNEPKTNTPTTKSPTNNNTKPAIKDTNLVGNNPPVKPAPPEIKVSKYVFPDAFTGNINIVLNDALSNIYKINFKNATGKVVLTIDRVDDANVILDKRNFQKSGSYSFEILKNNKPFETGQVQVSL